MSTSSSSRRLDPLHVFAVSVALFLASLLFLLAVMAEVSVATAATRAVIGWCVLSAVGIGLAMMVRWVLGAPRPAPPPPGGRFDRVIE